MLKEINLISIVFPCLNEEETLGYCIKNAIAVLSGLEIDYEIIVADNGSSDKSRTIALSLGANVVSVKKRGYGMALRAGIAAAKGDVVFMLDSDGSYPLDGISLYLESLHNGSDMVIGNRFKGGIDKGAMPFLHRYLGNPVLSFIGRKFFNIKIGDFHCGLRAFTKESVSSIPLVSEGMEFASELIVKFALAGMRIDEVPQRLMKDGRSRPPHLNTWPDGWRHLKFLIAFCPQSVLSIPGAICTSLGVFFSTILVTNFRNLTERIFSFQSLMVSIAVFTLGITLLCLQWLLVVFAEAIKVQIRSSITRNSHLVKEDFVYKMMIAGAISFLFGFLGLILAFTRWWENSFGRLDILNSIRITLPSTLSLIMGAQILATCIAVLVIQTLNKHSRDAE